MNLSTNQQKFKAFLLQHSTLAEEQVNELITYFKELQLAKGECFAEQNKCCSQIGFLVSGMLRAYSTDHDDKEFTPCFYKNNVLVTAYRSYKGNIPSCHRIEVIADATLLVIDRDTLKNVLPANYERELLYIFLEKGYRVMCDHTNYLSLKTVKDKYNIFSTKNRDVINSTTKADIASYFGVAREMLSFSKKKKGN